MLSKHKFHLCWMTLCELTMMWFFAHGVNAERIHGYDRENVYAYCPNHVSGSNGQKSCDDKTNGAITVIK